MTGAEKIERLAKWMGKDTPDGHDPRIMLGTDGRYYIDTVVCAYSKDAEPEYRVRIWNPLINLPDAWMLVEKLEVGDYSTWSVFVDIVEMDRYKIWGMTAAKAAAFISNTVLEVVL